MMKNIKWNDAQVKQTPNESILSATRDLDPNKRQSGSGFAFTFAILVTALIWGIELFLLATN